jgi:hypothetical protein
MPLNPSTLYFKDNCPKVPGLRPDTADLARGKPVKERDALLCKACGRVITHGRDRIVVQGTHRHTFANPQGQVFEIGCFQRATGCAYRGALTDEFTWFAGYQWKVAVCAGCLMHVGWLFVAAASQFNGLILNRLVNRNDRDP